MKRTTKDPSKVTAIMDKAYELRQTPFQSITSNFNPKTRLYEVVMR